MGASRGRYPLESRTEVPTRQGGGEGSFLRGSICEFLFYRLRRVNHRTCRHQHLITGHCSSAKFLFPYLDECRLLINRDHPNRNIKIRILY